MADPDIRMTRRSLLGLAASIGGASAAAGAGTMAAFTDTESSAGNSVQSGTLDLKLDGDDQRVTFLDAQDIQPGDSSDESVLLSNAGSIQGTLVIDVDDVRDYENTLLQSEQNAGDSSANAGELQQFVDVRVEIGGNQFIDWTPMTSLSTGTYETGETFAPGDEKLFTVYWRFRDEADVNQAQTDTVELDVTFRLEQSGGN